MEARPWHRQPDESAKAFCAFELFRDAGSARSIRQAYEAYTGNILGTKQVPGFFKGWYKRFKWPERVAAFDAWLEQGQAQAIERALMEKAEDLAQRRARLRERSLELEERALAEALRLVESMEGMPHVRAIATETRTIKGEEVVVSYDVFPAFGSFPLELKRLMEVGTRSQPQKVAPTDPSGEKPYQYGRDPADLDREWEEYLAKERRGELESG